MADKNNLDQQLPAQPETTVFRDDKTVYRNDTSISQSGAVNEASAEISNPASNVDTNRILKSRFVLEESIGSGGMGTVFRAKDLRKVEARDNQPYVAVKVLNNDFRQHPEAFIALEREASKSQTLRHSNIVSIFDFDKDGDVPYITMELLEGQELAQLLQSYPNGLPDELAWPIIEGMVLGLMHAHEEGVVHADFKPGNVYITHKNATKILDFGIARAMRANNGGEDTDFDPSRLAALTPAYASREMLNGDNAEPRDDLYSLGVVIYMVLTGLHPYGRVPADEAIKEHLRPERIKQLSRRRWRALEKCLSFNRQERPACTADLYEGLFGKAAWRSWTIAAAAAVISASVLFSSFQETAEIKVVKQEVRTETLVTAQVERITSLLAEPRFDVEWERTLFSEVQTLHTVSPDKVVETQMLGHISAAYAAAVSDSTSLDESFRLYQSAQQFNAHAASGEILETRLLGILQGLLIHPLDANWLATAEQTLSYVQRDFAPSSGLNEARAQVLERLFAEIAAIFRGELNGDVEIAEQAWNTFAHAATSESRRSEIDALLQLALEDAAARRAAQDAARLQQSLYSRMDNLVNVSCLRLDVGQVAALVASMAAEYPQYVTGLRERATTRISECVQQVGAVDPERGRSMQRQAHAQFASQAQFTGPGVDPCSMHYLVGNGRQRGSGGSCADDLVAAAAPTDANAEGNQQAVDAGQEIAEAGSTDNSAGMSAVMMEPQKGPRLVVVPGAEQQSKFAISKYEISWREFNAFCQQTALCTANEDSALPVTGVAVDVVESYAQWLSRKTGFRYRLPTRDEWLQVAKAELPLPTGCSRSSTGQMPVGADAEVLVDGVASNRFGVVHILGNVREMVKGQDAYLALGDTRRSSDGRCLLRTSEALDPQGDGSTGFRLVREVS